MRVLVVFLVFLCFILWRGYHDVDEHAQHNSNRNPAGQVEEGQRKVGPAAALRNSSLSEEKQCFAGFEEEDECPLAARKYIMLAGCLFIVAGIAFLSGFIACFKEYLSLYGYLPGAYSSKYMLQQVLRI